MIVKERIKMRNDDGSDSFINPNAPPIGGPWQLINIEGDTVTHHDLKGEYYLVYFGTTKCPEVCPFSLLKMVKVNERLKKSSEFQYFDF